MTSMNLDVPKAVIITGVFGSGKSSVAAEIVDILEQQCMPYALLDLDFLGWFDAGDDGPTGQEMMLKNLTAVVDNYLMAGVKYFVLAHSLRDEGDLRVLRSHLRMPLRVVRLDVPLSDIAMRLSTDPTTGRQDDLRRAREWIANGTGEGIEDISLRNERPIREVATDILEWLAWL